jgi:hypothetical protein
MRPIIILGTGNSGSGAVSDYLVGRGDVVDALDGQEFRLLQERGGLSSLHRSLAMETHPDDAMYALIKFRKMAGRLGADSRKIRIPPLLGYGFSRRIPAYNAALAEFLNNITSCYFGIFPLQDLLELTTLDWVRFMLGRAPRSRKIVTRKPVPVPEAEFMRHAEHFIWRLFYDGRAQSAPRLLFDQAGSFWSPVSSTRYFGGERRVIGVTRDPCDVYAANRKRLLGGAEGFARYCATLNRLVAAQEWRDPRALMVPFEDFVLRHDETRDRICKLLDMDPAVPSAYDWTQSAKNIGRYKDMLTREEIAVLQEIPPILI